MGSEAGPASRRFGPYPRPRRHSLAHRRLLGVRLRPRGPLPRPSRVPPHVRPWAMGLAPTGDGRRHISVVPWQRRPCPTAPARQVIAQRYGTMPPKHSFRSNAVAAIGDDALLRVVSGS
jgi:hypothetical protein